MRISIVMLLTLAGCSLKSFITPAATITGAAVGGIGGPGGAALGSGIGYATGELYTLRDENKQLVTAITTGDVQGIVAAQMKSQFKSQEGKIQEVTGKIQEVTGSIWSTLKIAAFAVIGIMCIPLFITRHNTKKINEICEETKNGKTDKTVQGSEQEG